MNKMHLKFVFLLVAVVMACIYLAGAEVVNESASTGLFWSTAKEEADLVLRSSISDETQDSSVGGSDELDGGFSSLDGMLQWAIGRSDPEKLKETAEDVKKLSVDELNKRQNELKELMERLKTPSDAQLMQIAIDDLNNTSVSVEDRRRALQELLILVEPIDNANDLDKLGGLAVVIRELNDPDLEIRVTSAWILGTAGQNNPVVQKQVLELGALPKLMKMVKSSSTEEAVKALYAVSALIRNNEDGQKLFNIEDGDVLLQDIISNSTNDIRLLRKAVFLLGDLAQQHLESKERVKIPVFSNQYLLKTVVDLTSSSDLDLQEKALFTIKTLLQLETTEAHVFKDFCGLDKALEKLQRQLSSLVEVEFQRDYATEVENLRRDVEIIFHSKLEKA